MLESLFTEVDLQRAEATCRERQVLCEAPCVESGVARMHLLRSPFLSVALDRLAAGSLVGGRLAAASVWKAASGLKGTCCHRLPVKAPQTAACFSFTLSPGSSGLPRRPWGFSA